MGFGKTDKVTNCHGSMYGYIFLGHQGVQKRVSWFQDNLNLKRLIK